GPCRAARRCPRMCAAAGDEPFAPRPKPSRYLAGMHDVDAARRVMGDSVGDAAQQVAPDTGHAAVADDEQVGADLLGDGEEGVRRLPQASNWVRADTGPREPLSSSADDLLRGDAFVVAEPRRCGYRSPHRADTREY